MLERRNEFNAKIYCFVSVEPTLMQATKSKDCFQKTFIGKTGGE